MEITVRAHARGERAPDYALVVLEVGFESARLEEAHRAAQALASQLSDDLADARRDHSEGFGTTVISPVSTRSWRPWNNDGKQLPIRYGASSRVEVEVRDLDLLGQLTRAWGSTQGVKLAAPQWKLDEATRDDLVAEVTAAAVRQARQRASVMAEASGFSELTPLQLADTGLLGDGGARDLDATPAFGARAAAYAPQDEQQIDLTPRPLDVEVVVEARFRAS